MCTRDSSHLQCSAISSCCFDKDIFNNLDLCSRCSDESARRAALWSTFDTSFLSGLLDKFLTVGDDDDELESTLSCSIVMAEVDLDLDFDDDADVCDSDTFTFSLDT